MRRQVAGAEDGAGTQAQAVWLLHPHSPLPHRSSHEGSSWEHLLAKDKESGMRGQKQQLGREHFENELHLWGTWSWRPDTESEEF